MLEFISFSSGSNGNSYMLHDGWDALMIDAGIGNRRLAKFCQELGVPLGNVRGLLLTHDHTDHVKSAGNLSFKHGLPVFATRAVHNGVRSNFRVHHKPTPDLTMLVEPGKTFMLGSFSITPFPVPHDSLDNVGYRIEHDGTVFCLMTDIGHVTDELKQEIARAHYLVVESNYDREMLQHGRYPEQLKKRILGLGGHLSNDECAEMLAECATPTLKHVWLCHLSAENNRPDLARETVEKKLKERGIEPGRDLQLDVLQRTLPTGPFRLEE